MAQLAEVFRHRRVGLVGLGLVALHLLAAVLFLVDVRLPFALILACTAVVIAVERPLVGISLLIAGRLTSTGANAWVRIGRINLDLFEPALALCLLAIFTHGVLHRQRIFGNAPWRGAVLALLAYQVVSLGWSSDLGDSIKSLLSTGTLLATTLVIVQFVRSWKQVRAMLFLWIAVCVGIVAAVSVGIGGTETAFEMAQGSRESGFGQHPNWFAMNLGFIVVPSFALATIERRLLVRLMLAGAGLFIFLGQGMSGSRGGTFSILIGAGLVALVHPRFRKWAVAAGGLLCVAIGAILWFEIGDAWRAYERVWVASSQVLGASVRESNWAVCWQMFLDTFGLGISGGYEVLLPRYDSWLSDSQYTYPHGIFWGLLAHYGVVGIAVFTWFLFRVAQMTRDALRSLDRDQGLVAWAMLASMIGYLAWSFFEFSYQEKPFWEFLALFTALCAIGSRAPEAE